MLDHWSYKSVYTIWDKVLQTQAQAFLGEDLDVMDTWDIEEFAEVMEHLRIMKTIVTAILEPNMGGNPYNPPSQVNRNSHLLPKMSFFLGKIEDGHNFLETFKVAATGMQEREKVVTFKTLCRPEVAT